MGCAGSSPSTLEHTSNSATTDGKLDMNSGCIEEEIAEAEMKNAERIERVLPASDIVDTNVDRSNESSTAAAATVVGDIQIVDMELEPSSSSVEDKLVKRSRVGELTIGNGGPDAMSECPPKPKTVEADTLRAAAEAAPEDASDTIVDELGEEKTQTPELLVLDTGQEQEDDESAVITDDHLRPTRWEALADVAAELPPKLTIDPLTGQIYTLSRRD